MPYTLLRRTEKGVVLWDYHLRRLGLTSPDARSALVTSFREASPGVWAVWSDGRGLRVEARAGSRLSDGIPVRTAVSPVLGRGSRLPKPGGPSAYDPVRVAGVATLLTSPDGGEVLEACCAAVVSWDGEHIVCPPRDRPRIWSTSLAAIREHLPVREAAIPATSEALLLVNAVAGTCKPGGPCGSRFPAEIRAQIDDLFGRLTKLPGD